MKTTRDLVKIYTGPEASTRLLELRLEQIGIHALTKNDNTGAFIGLLPPSIDLWINDDVMK